MLVLVPVASLIGCQGGTATQHSDRGIALVGERRYEEAISEFTIAIELDPNLTMAYYNRGTLFADTGEYERAVADYTRAIELLAGKLQYEEAITGVNDIGLALNYAWAYYNRGLGYKALGNKAEAVADFEEFITLTDNSRWIETAEQQIDELSK